MAYLIGTCTLLTAVFLNYISLVFLHAAFYFDVLGISFTVIALFVFIYESLISYTESTEMIVKVDTLIKKSYHDELSDLGSANAYEAYFENLDVKLHIFYIAAFDLDKLKKLNDLYGHAKGDEAIKTFGQIINENRNKPEELAFRIGGDEFLFVTEKVAEQKDFAKTVSKMYFEATGETVSYAEGVFNITGSKSFSDALSILDRDLMEEKRRKHDAKK